MLCSPRALVVLLLVVAITATATAAEFDRQFSTDADALILRNLVGKVRVTAAAGDQYEILVSVRGSDADPDLIDVTLDDGRNAELIVRFPIEKHRDYVYPELGRRGKATIYQPDQGGGGWLSKLWRGIGGEKVTIRGHGRGLEVWADVEIQVPAGRTTEVFLGAGNLASAGVDGKLVLDTHNGPVEVQGHTGRLVCDTGSGHVGVADIDGALLVDTGSGSVDVRGHQGRTLEVDTGSGSVRIDNVNTEKLHVDTGSGGVVCTGVSTDKATIDTGSGAVELMLDRMGTGRFVIDTGSGGVKLVLPADASAMISVDTGSGGIRNEIPDAEVLHKSRGEMKLRVGGGETRFIVDTGSGGVTIASR